MKKFLLFLILIFCISFVYSGTVQNSEAKIIALNWINSQGAKYFEMGDVSSVYSKVSNKVPIYYIVSFKPSGWVIISASDVAEPVLGYSLESRFDINSLPPQVDGWMGGITDEIEAAIKNKLAPSFNVRQKWQTYGGKLVERQNLKSTKSIETGPLLSSTWGQGTFYNEMAPADETSSTGNDHVWLGCVATAMVQVMKFWEYPSSGMGSHSYDHPDYGIQSANFGSSYYNWSMMPNDVTSLNTEVQKIGYHCAVSVDMDFGPNASGAWYSPAVLINNFKYNSTIFESSKSQWNDTEWENLLRKEIDEGRPVLYSGYNSSGSSGHAWVCDGYSSDDYFHFNWGWNGNANGNFLLSDLTPGTSNYTYNQAALFSIEPVIPASIRIPFTEDFESSAPDGISLMGVNELTTDESHTGAQSLRLGRESIVYDATNAASLCFLVPAEAELNFWVKRFTPAVSSLNQQKALIMPEFGSTPLFEIYNGDYNDSDWVSFNVNLSAYEGQILRLLFLEEVTDISKRQWTYIDDVTISGLSNNLAPFTPSRPNPSDQADYVSLNPVLRWSGGDPNGDDLIYHVYFGATETPPLISSVFNNYYAPPALDHSTTYFWKIVADDDSLTKVGPVWSFTTKGIPPTLGNCGVSNLTSTSMKICGEILNYNLSTVESRGICWSQSPNPSISSSYIEVEEPTDVFTCDISGLLPNTTYYYRAFARSNQGDAYSTVLSIKTLPALPVVAIEGVNNILRSTASLNGKIISINDSSVFHRGVVWSTVSAFNPSSGHIVSENGFWPEPGNFSIIVSNLPGPDTFYVRLFAENSIGIAYSNELMFSTTNVAPVIDLDADNNKGGLVNDFIGNVIERKSGGVICDNDVEISDHDGDPIIQLQVELLNACNVESEFLTVLSDNENLLVEGNETGQLLLTTTRSFTFEEWENVIKSIEYRNNLYSPQQDTIRKIQLRVSDGFDSSTIAQAFIKVIPVNDPPVNQIPPKLNTIPVFESMVTAVPGTWEDIFDKPYKCEESFVYSYSWQLKDERGEIKALDYDYQQSIPVEENLCGDSIRVIEKITDNCGGREQSVNQAESKWYPVRRAAQTITLDPIPVHNMNEGFFLLKGKSSSGLPLTYNLLSHNNVISISEDTAYIQNAGGEVILGIQPGNKCFLPSEGWNKNIVIGKGSQNIEFEQIIEEKYNAGLIKMPARATSGLDLTVISSDSTIAFVENDTIFFTGIGRVTLSIFQPGNQNYFTSETVEMFVTVLKGDQYITTQYPDELKYGLGRYPYIAVSSSQLKVKLTSSNPSVIEIAGDSLVVKGVGNVIISAKQPGDQFWNYATDVVDSLFVKKGIQEIFVEPVGEIIFPGSTFVPVSHSSSGLEVTFSVRDTSIADVVDGKIVIKNVGETIIDFIQNGNELWEPAFNDTPLKIVKASQFITFNSIETQHFGVGPIELVASSNSGLDVVFEISDLEVATISGDTLYVHNAGTAEIKAIQPGNNQFHPADPVTINLHIEKATQTVLSHLPDSLVFDHQVIFADVESTSGLSINIVSSNDKIVKVITDSLQITGPGEVLLTLNQSGDRNYLPAELVVRIEIIELVSVPITENTLFSIYPNPTNGKFILLIKNNLSNLLQVCIINSSGKSISNFRTENPVNQIDLSTQPQGLYFLVVRTPNGNIAKKLLISR